MTNYFSIIIPSFNQGQYIQKTIDSILEQNYSHFEILVMDGGSTDNTVKILESYGKKIYWVSEKDDGQTHAINKGLKLAKGNIIGYINSDDWYLPGCFDSVNQFFQKNADKHWVTGEYSIVNDQGKPIQKLVSLYKTMLRRFFTVNTIFIINFIAQPSTFWKRDVFEQIGYFDESLRYTMDYDYWLRIKPHFLLGIIDQPLSCFRIHCRSKGGSQYQKQFEEEWAVIQKYTRNSILLILHQLHNFVIVMCYKWMKNI